eukprot:CAMPEP_0206236482 /NCGR_PEP_ID=MMETSP0047_2-20121206/13742_1 /ASSEMBLY_ACC=CAM_ASM_000192 /TAXON_ID=195065 /ORGANISM="Chroomonas mesostigmatica_cf, Strain CCMP1168" /LENGTH=277 /DNA_ID=CAMNT_0053660827 /DNA_START=61 /DNA_END=892 /DNA_ORIENTATION=-
MRSTSPPVVVTKYVNVTSPPVIETRYVTKYVNVTHTKYVDRYLPAPQEEEHAPPAPLRPSQHEWEWIHRVRKQLRGEHWSGHTPVANDFEPLKGFSFPKGAKAPPADSAEGGAFPGLKPLQHYTDTDDETPQKSVEGADKAVSHLPGEDEEREPSPLPPPPTQSKTTPHTGRFLGDSPTNPLPAGYTIRQASVGVPLVPTAPQARSTNSDGRYYWSAGPNGDIVGPPRVMGDGEPPNNAASTRGGVQMRYPVAGSVVGGGLKVPLPAQWGGLPGAPV